MAEYTNVDKYFQDKLAGLRRAKKEIQKSIASDVANTVRQAMSEEDVKVEQKENTVIIDIASTKESEDIIDLKQYFRQSPNKKQSKDGGWHMIIPIRRYTSRNKETREKSSGMTSRLYKDLLSSKSKGYANMVSDYLYDNRRAGSPIAELNYRPQSKNITRIPRETRGHKYISFRTVSDKSHPASWLVNRGKVDTTNKSAEVRRIIDEVKRYNYSRR